MISCRNRVLCGLALALLVSPPGLRADTITALAISPNGRTFFAGTDGGDVFKSPNAGALWVEVDRGLRGAVNDLEVDPSRPTTLFAATSAGFFLSNDNGASWRQASFPGIRQPVGALSVVAEPASPGVVYVSLATLIPRVFRSADHGLTWQRAAAGLAGQVRTLAAHPTLPGVLFAGTTAGAFLSTNAGQTWARSGLDGDNIARLIVHPQQPVHLYAIREVIKRGGNLYSEILVSRSAGLAWELAAVYEFPGTSDLAADPFSAPTVYTSFSEPLGGDLNGVVFKTHDAGDNWQRVLRSDSGVHVLAANPRRPGVVLAGAEGDGLFMTRDAGVTWTRIQLPIAADLP